ncbi:hypothetical protein BCV70DRAFT_201832 [Testicularia cyperi]|uniref:DUF427 domain-containing protein n=1 Tax=Testicularia cyperi TaxID=1882483 RepID=A0A317XL39_9BASI|nr:hypothetical protein BCV70DRAFT_201832 [Testicularia cyperi]
MPSAAEAKPLHRIVTQPLSKRLVITASLDGRSITVIDTTSTIQLAETNYPVRYYFPKEAVQKPIQLISSDANETYCPFKGFACYFDGHLPGTPMQQFRSAFWSYRDPFPESDAVGIRGLLCLDAPSDRFTLTVDGQPISKHDAKAINTGILDRHPSSISSPKQTREAEEGRLSRSRSRPRTRHQQQDHLQPPDLKRSVSSSSADAPTFQVGGPPGAEFQPDSSNPFIADMVYRLDDEAHEGHHAHERDGQAKQDNNAPEEAVVDDHLLWFRNEPWYRKPSVRWLRPFAFLIAMAGGMCVGPKLELLNMFVCEKVLGDQYVGGGGIVGADPAFNASTWSSLSAKETHTSSDTFAPWAQARTEWLASERDPRSDDETVNQYLAALSAPNSTNLPPIRRPSKECYKSPEVQSALASLQLRMTLSMGLLAALTTGFWSNLSSRKGRLPVLRISMAGIICTDILMLTVALVPRSSLPFGYNFLVLGTTLEGLLGGYSTAIAVHQSYISDVTPSGTRAHIFASFMGIVWAGLALGPTLGGLMVKHTNYVLAIFWLTLAIHVVYAIGICTVIPESTSAAFRVKAAKEHQHSLRERKRKAEERKTAEVQPLLGSSRTWEGEHRPFKKRVWKHVKLAFMNSFLYAPLEPLSFLLPKKVLVESDRDENGAEPSASGMSTPRRHSLAAPEASASHISVSRVSPQMRYDCNLFFLSMAYFVESAIYGIMSFKMQYAQEQFLWGAAELGMYLTFTSVARVVALTLILPVVIKLLHRPVQALSLPHDGAGNGGEEAGHEDIPRSDPRRRSMLDDEGRALRGQPSYGTMEQSESPRASPTPDSASDGERTTDGQENHADWDETKKDLEELWTLRAKHLRLIHDSKFDLKLSKISAVINASAYVLLVFSKSPSVFLLGTAIMALGGGGGAALSSLALALLKSPADAGKLFGAWSITSAIAGTVVGPILFAEVFAKTTATFPEAIFAVGTAMFILALVVLSLVKVRKPISLPSLPARPHPVQNADSTDQPDTSTARSNFRPSTWKSAFSLKSTPSRNPAAKPSTKNGGASRPGMPSFS